MVNTNYESEFTHTEVMKEHYPCKFDYVVVPRSSSDGQEISFVVVLNAELSVDSKVACTLTGRKIAEEACAMLRKFFNSKIKKDIVIHGGKKSE